MATIQEIAEKAGVSRGTVDRALNNRGRINPQVAEKIRQIADELGYVTRSQRKGERPAEKVRIGVITQLAGASFMLEINRGLREAQAELMQWGIELIVKESMTVNEEEQLKTIDELLAEGIRGLAIMPVDSTAISLKLNEVIETHKIPVVTFNSDIAGTKRTCFIGMDNRRSGQTAAEDWYNEDGSLIMSFQMEYGADGLLLSEKQYNAEGSLDSTRVYDYDDQGRDIRHSDYSPDGTLLGYYTMEYDEEGNVTRYSNYDGDGQLLDYEIRRYDETGGYLGSEWYDSTGGLISSTVSE